MSDDPSDHAFRLPEKAAPFPKGSFGQEDGRRHLSAPSAGDVNEHVPGEIATWIDRESDEKWQIEVPDELTDEHELVRKTRNAFDLENLNRRGLAWPPNKGTLDVVVAPENIDRAQRIVT